MNKIECIKRLTELSAAWNINEAVLDQEDIDAINSLIHMFHLMLADNKKLANKIRIDRAMLEDSVSKEKYNKLEEKLNEYHEKQLDILSNLTDEIGLNIDLTKRIEQVIANIIGEFDDDEFCYCADAVFLKRQVSILRGEVNEDNHEV